MSETTKAAIADRFRKERHRLKLSVLAAASACGITRQQLTRIEGGRSVPGGIALAGIARCGADVAYILTGTRSSPDRVDAHAIASLVTFRIHGLISGDGATPTICDRWKEQRQSLGHKSGTAFAATHGLPQSTVSRIESGKNPPSAEALIALANSGGDTLYVLTGRRAPSIEIVERAVREACTFWANEVRNGRE